MPDATGAPTDLILMQDMLVKLVDLRTGEPLLDDDGKSRYEKRKRGDPIPEARFWPDLNLYRFNGEIVMRAEIFGTVDLTTERGSGVMPDLPAPAAAPKTAESDAEPSEAASETSEDAQSGDESAEPDAGDGDELFVGARPEAEVETEPEAEEPEGRPRNATEARAREKAGKRDRKR